MSIKKIKYKIKLISELFESNIIPIIKVYIFIDIYFNNGVIKRDITVSIYSNKFHVDPSRLDSIELKQVSKMIEQDSSLKLALSKMAGKVPRITTEGSLIKVKNTKECVNLIGNTLIEKRNN